MAAKGKKGSGRSPEGKKARRGKREKDRVGKQREISRKIRMVRRSDYLNDRCARKTAIGEVMSEIAAGNLRGEDLPTITLLMNGEGKEFELHHKEILNYLSNHLENLHGHLADMKRLAKRYEKSPEHFLSQSGRMTFDKMPALGHFNDLRAQIDRLTERIAKIKKPTRLRREERALRKEENALQNARLIEELDAIHSRVKEVVVWPLQEAGEFIPGNVTTQGHEEREEVSEQFFDELPHVLKEEEYAKTRSKKNMLPFNPKSPVAKKKAKK